MPVINTVNYPASPLEAKPYANGVFAYDAVVLVDGAFDCGTAMYIDQDGKADKWIGTVTEHVDHSYKVPDIVVNMPTLPDNAEPTGLTNVAGSTEFIENTDYRIANDKIELIAGGDAIKEGALKVAYSIPGDPDPTTGSEQFSVPDNKIDVNLPAGEISEMSVSDGEGHDYTVSTDYTYSEGVLTLVSGGGASGAERVAVEATITVTQADPSGLLAYPVRAEDSRAAAILTKGTVYASQVPDYDATLAGKLADIDFVVDNSEPAPEPDNQEGE